MTRFWSLLSILLFPALIAAQGRSSVIGYVSDQDNGETLLFANVIVKGTTTGTSTNTSGFYRLVGLEPGSYVLEFRFVGYETKDIPIQLSDGQTLRLDVALKPEDFRLEEVVVESEREREESRNLGVAQVQTRLIKQVPAVLQADVFRSMQLLPGVKSASDFSSGLYIRGGGPDQTLILLDRTTVYNPSHFFGFFSTFNPDAIKDVRLYKGGYPAEYGGRLGSVIDIYNKDGNRLQQGGVLSLGMLSSRAMIEGPYSKGSYMFAFRRSTLEPLLYALQQQVDNVPESFYFYDVNGKVTVDADENNKLSLSFYGGEDNVKFPFSDDLTFKLYYGNRTASSTWTHLFSNNLFGNVTVTGSRYFNEPKFEVGGTPITRNNNVYDISLKSDLDWAPNAQHDLKAGIWAGLLTLTLEDRFDSNPTTRSRIRSSYASGYVQDTWRMGQRLKVTSGVRLNYFTKGDYLRVEPRLSIEHIPHASLRLQAAYGRYTQFLTLITNEAFSGFDVWLTTDEGVRPSWGDQFVLGVKSYPVQGYNVEIEGFYRTMNDLFELDPRLPDVAGLEYSELFRYGSGFAYGAEFLVEKTSGRLNGFIGYTWGSTRRKFETFNQNQFYPPKYDRIHDVNIVANYRLSRRWKTTSVFSYATGQAYTEVLGRAEIESPFGPEPYRPVVVGNVNASRLPSYHRLDVGLTREGTFFGKGTSEFQIQIINLYSRRNIWFYNFDLEANPATRTAVPLLPLLPTLSYTVTF
jgi:hypothetical protein